MTLRTLYRSLACAILLGAAMPASAVPIAAVQWSGGNATGIPSQTTLLAYEFNPVADLSVFALGIYDRTGDGLAADMVVGLFERTGLFTSNLLARVVLPAGISAYLVDNYRYLDIPAVELEAGLTYQVVAMYSSSGSEGGSSGPSTSLTFDPALGPVTKKGVQGNSITDVMLVNSNFGGFSAGPNFRFEAAPAPGTLALLAIGALALLGQRRRRVRA